MIQAVGDFNGDGKADLLWRNTSTGQVGEWLSNTGSGYAGFTAPIIAVIDPSWQIDGVGDFNGDGKADILWRNTATGQVGEWLSKAGTGYAGFTAPILTTIDPSWQLQGVPPALQGNLVSSAAPLAQAMASMSAPGGAGHTGAAPGGPPSIKPIIAITPQR